MNEERLEREKNKRIKLNGTSTEQTSQSTSHSSQISHLASSSNGNSTSSSTNGNTTTTNGNTPTKKVTTNGNTTTNGTSEKQEDKKEIAKINPKMSKLLSTSGKRIQKELAEITIDPPPNCR